MPAGATLISPWVDLTHSFASIMKDDSKDYIPSECVAPPTRRTDSFLTCFYSWPPQRLPLQGATACVRPPPHTAHQLTLSPRRPQPSTAWPPIPDDDEPLPIEVEHPETGKVETRLLREQVQMYASNQMLDHPLVSPINQGSLGGLCPLMVVRPTSLALRDRTSLASR